MIATPFPSRTVAVVDDDPGLRRLIRNALEKANYQVVEGSNGREAVEIARSAAPHAMILDIRMPVMSGMEAFPLVKAERPETAVLLLTAHMDLRDAVSAIKAGAQDYLEKPIDLDELIVAVDEALGQVRAESDSPAEDLIPLPAGVIARSAPARTVFREALRAAPTGATVLLLGESGTGKEVLARFIHSNSERRAGPFVAVNCATFPENLIESELFGHERGAFTGASASRAGRFEEASGGTLLLDEIGEMPLALQPKLLRALEEKRVRRVGGSRDIPVDIRVIAATNRPLEEDARAGRFREDLLYRLNVFAVEIPPLRLRREDIEPLALSFLQEQTAQEGAPGRGKRFAPATLRLLEGYDWPGNVRELRNAVARACIISRGSLILPEDLPDPVRAGRQSRTALPSSGDRKAAPGPADAERRQSTGAGAGLPPVGQMEEIQKRAILDALEQAGGNKTRAAQILGISRRNLIYKLRSYGM